MAYYNGKHPKKDENQTELFGEFKSFREEVSLFIETWNGFIWLPKIIGSDRQCAEIRKAMDRPFFQRNWRDSFAMMAKSSFLRKLRPAFRLDWYLTPDNFDKIIEGKYLDDKYKTPTEPSKTTRTGDDEWIT